jgi:hypothetical protein
MKTPDALDIETPSRYDAAPWETLERLNYLTAMGAAHAFSCVAAEMRVILNRRWSDEHFAVVQQAFSGLIARIEKTPLFERATETSVKDA